MMAVLFFLLSLSTAQAQIWADLTPIFEQLDAGDREDFSNDLTDLIDEFDYNSFQLNGAIDSLFLGLGGLGVNGPIDSMLAAWGNNRDNLLEFLDNSGLGMGDSLLIISEYDRVNELWYLNLDSLNQVLNNYQDTIPFDPDLADEAGDRFEVFEGLWTQIFGDLQEMVEGGFDATDPNGIGNFRPVLDTLFGSLFDLELAFGQENANAFFWGEEYSIRTSVMRVGSVPRFNTSWEARWHLQGSFFNADETNVRETTSIEEGFNSFLCNAQFAIMYNPIINCVGGTVFRLYSSLGFEMNTYAPAHNLADDRRVGNTTGYGPQMGAGMIVNVGDAISFYTFGTLSTGQVVDEDSFWSNTGYRHSSRSINAGLRYGNAVNLLYTHGTGDWARNGNKSVEFSRITLGIILDTLGR